MYISAERRAIKKLGAHQLTKVWTISHFKKHAYFAKKKQTYQSSLGFMAIRGTLIDQSLATRPRYKSTRLTVG